MVSAAEAGHGRAPAGVGLPGLYLGAYFLPPFACASALAATLRERAELRPSVMIFDAWVATRGLVTRELDFFDIGGALPPSPPVCDVRWGFAFPSESQCPLLPTRRGGTSLSRMSAQGRRRTCAEDHWPTPGTAGSVRAAGRGAPGRAGGSLPLRLLRSRSGSCHLVRGARCRSRTRVPRPAHPQG